MALTKKALLDISKQRAEELRAQGSALYWQIKSARAERAKQTKLASLSKRDKPAAPSPEEMERICRTLVPGYDPWRDAGDQYVFSPELASEEVQWAHNHLTHTKGSLAGKAFELMPWQQAVWGNLFGWVHKDTGLRRYRTCDIFVPEKNGKTPFAAGIALRVYFGDDEPGSETYCVSWTIPQAMLVREWAASMIENDDWLSERADITQHAIYRVSEGERERNAWFKTIAAAEKGLHGPNVHCAVVDELHTFESEGSLRVLKSKMAARDQPLFVSITTAGWDRESVCYKQWQYAKGVRDGREGFCEPTHLPVVFETPEDADWTKEETWKAANPNWGVSFKPEVMRLAYEDVVRDPSQQNLFRQLKLNQWTQQAVRYIPMDAWDACPGEAVDLEPYYGDVAWLGFDGAVSEDLAALTMILRHADGGFIFRSWAFIPEDTARERERQDKVPYRHWGECGLITMTPGKTTDWRFIEKRIEWCIENFQVSAVAIDPAKAKQWALAASDRLGIDFIEVPQTAVKLNEPTETFKRLVIEQKIHHGSDPVLRWQAGNCQLKRRSDDLAQIVKPSRSLRVDGMVAGVIALSRAIAEDGVSVYETDGPAVYEVPAKWDSWSKGTDDGW